MFDVLLQRFFFLVTPALLVLYTELLLSARALRFSLLLVFFGLDGNLKNVKFQSTSWSRDSPEPTCFV